VKPAAIVNYEKYVTHPITPAPVKNDVKSKAKAGTKAVAHHAPAKHVPAKHVPDKPAPVKKAPVKQPPVTQAALKTKDAGATAAISENTAASRPAASPKPAAAATGQKKPSAGIRKETPQN